LIDLRLPQGVQLQFSTEHLLIHIVEAHNEQFPDIHHGEALCQAECECHFRRRLQMHLGEWER
jgi:hypothetical protein